ncbi:protein TALPID3 isoform X2 [Toxotes jaculatrix]|uniref:protein TALPID3 isoform X2 n=1 Tax=Toxotes jaculatrix TaxID=941984 RepID=UPI001B3AC9FD|nr:protein TALPID3 isoform X2 [Toxotes jaculatrix]
MFRQPAVSSHTPRDLPGDLSPDQSSYSSDTGDILIRSTRILLPDRRCGAGSGPGSVQITVQKLKDPAPVQQQPPRAKPRQKPETCALPRPAAGGQPGKSSDRWMLKEPGQTKENQEPSGKPPTEKRKLSAGTQSDQQAGHDLLTSRFTPGGRGVVLTALKQCSHSAPRRREVKVKLLKPESLKDSSQGAPGPRSSSQHVVGVQRVAGLSSGHQGDTSSAAAAPLIKAASSPSRVQAQSDVEARVCRLEDDVQRLLQVDREGGDGGRSLSQQTLQHLEMLHSQQLQLQSQLLESALRMVTSHAPMTSTTSELTASGQPAHLQVTHLDAAANVLSNQRRSSSATRAAAVTAAAAAVETRPVTMATPSRDRWPEQTRSDQYRRGTPSVSTATQPPERTDLQPSANHSQAVVRKANEVLREVGQLRTEMKMLLTPAETLKTTRPPPDNHQSQSNLLQSQLNHLQSQQSQSQPQQHQSHRNLSQPNHFQSQQNHTKFQSQSGLVQRKHVVPSILEEAHEVLRQVQRRKKVLEENLEAVQRAKTGEILHCQLEALAANRDWTAEVRIKKTVDAWISALSKDIQAETSSEDAALTSELRTARSFARTGTGRPVSALRETGSKTAVVRGGQGQRARQGPVQGVKPGRVPGVPTDSEQLEGESYLTRLYGRAPYEGLRRTLKKSPYLHFSSPVSPLRRKPRPRLVESIRGVKVKSCKTQTSLAPPLSPSPGQPHHQDMVSSSHMTFADPTDLTVTPADAYSVPMTIPLGRRRIGPSSRCPTERQQEVPSLPTPTSTFGAAAVADGAPEPQPQREEHLDAGEDPPPPPRPSNAVIETKSEDEENVFPGTDFLSVADVVQEEVSVVGEEAVEVDGGPSPPPVLYQGPAFPPQARSALPAQGPASIQDPVQQRETLENQLIQWVEQQLMSRMISEMYCPLPPDPTQNVSTDQSELEERSVTSDIVEAAGGGGLQLFVDSSMSVDSTVIRQLVNEVLTEIVALMLGQRDPLDTGPGPAAYQEDKLVPLVSTPVPTPPPSQTTPVGQTPPTTTPLPSEPTSLLNEASPQPITAPEPVATPTSSPEPAPVAESSPGLHPDPPPLTWGDAELPLDEERPEEHLETHKQAMVMSVAEEEPPLSSPFSPPPTSLPPAPSPSPHLGPDPRAASPSSSSGDSSSSGSSGSSSSSSTVTAGTDAALRHISEGELLISVNQLAATTEEEAVCSFSSSLQELQDMDYDPPSEGQVRGHDLLLARGERPQPEGSWGREDQDQEEVSVGEVRDDWTTDPRSNSKGTAARRSQTSSPGQISQCADVSDVSFEVTNQGLVTMGNLMVEPLGTLTSDLQTDLSLSPPPPHLENMTPADTRRREEPGGWMFICPPSDRWRRRRRWRSEQQLIQTQTREEKLRSQCNCL